MCNLRFADDSSGELLRRWPVLSPCEQPCAKTALAQQKSESGLPQQWPDWTGSGSGTTSAFQAGSSSTSLFSPPSSSTAMKRGPCWLTLKNKGSRLLKPSARGNFSVSPSPRGLTFTWWGCCGLYFWRNPTELVHSFLSCSCVCFCFYGPPAIFLFINSPGNSPLSHSVLPVLFLPYWSFQLYISVWKSPSALI